MYKIENGNVFDKIIYSSDKTSHYIKLSSGLIIQWGIVTKGSNLKAESSWETTISFPVSFSSTAYSITFGSTSESTTQNASGEEIYANNRTIKSIDAKFYCRNSSSTCYSPQINWIAIGV